MAEKEKSSLFWRIIKWTGLSFLILLLLASILFQAQWKVATLPLAILLTSIVLLKHKRKYFWLSVGILAIPYISHITLFFSGKPNVTVDYVAQYNKLLRPVDDESLDAASLYEEAAEKFKEIPEGFSRSFLTRYSDLSTENKEIISSWVSQNEEVLKLVKKGVERPYYLGTYEKNANRYLYSYYPAPKFSARYQLKDISRCLQWRAKINAAKDEYEMAFGDLLTCYSLGQQVRRNPVVLNHLLGIALEGGTARIIRQILDEYRIESNMLVNLQANLKENNLRESFVPALTGEKLEVYDRIQQGFTDDGRGGGHVYLGDYIAGARKSLSENFFKGITEIDFTWPLWAIFLHPDKKECLEMTEQFFGLCEEIAQKNPGQVHAEGIDLEKKVTKMVRWNIPLMYTHPQSLRRAWELTYEIEGEIKGTLVVIAALRYEQDKGKWPPSLEELVRAGYIDEAPIDPYSTEPLVYELKDDGFILYSVGMDFEDDGGKVNKKNGWYGEADRIIWPLQE